MSNSIAIQVEGVSKRYVIGKAKDGSLRGSLANIFQQKSTNESEFWALRNISFTVEHGDVVGIIGKNGAGKSTLLKILSQITRPTTGKIEINGRVASLLEVGTGFHPELTGRENIYLNGTILGMSRQEVKSKFDEIVAFSGVEKFIDTPVKHYSSGMYVRLAFAVAAHLEPEILIIDEVLAVGDAEFQKKCLGKMKDVSKQGRTVLFVSHNMAAVRSLCNKGIVLQHGEIIKQGTQEEAITTYFSKSSSEQKFLFQGSTANAPGNEFVRLLRVEATPRSGNILSIYSGIDFEVGFYCGAANINIDVTLEVLTQEELVVFHKGMLVTKENDSRVGYYSLVFSLPMQLLNVGTYHLTLIFGQNQRIVLGRFDEIITFEVTPESVGSNSTKLPGIIFPELETKSSFNEKPDDEL